MSGSKPTSRLPCSAVIVLVVIGIAAVTRRSLVLLWPARFRAGTSPAAALDAAFARHAALTFVHILPGALFVGLATVRFAHSFVRNICSFVVASVESSSSPD